MIIENFIFITFAIKKTIIDKTKINIMLLNDTNKETTIKIIKVINETYNFPR